LEAALAVPARAASTLTVEGIIFSFLLSDIVRLPFDSNSTKVGVSRHIGTNGTADHRYVIRRGGASRVMCAPSYRSGARRDPKTRPVTLGGDNTVDRRF
jgi:hypothetical protein